MGCDDPGHVHDLTAAVGPVLDAQGGLFTLDPPRALGADRAKARKAISGRTVRREHWILVVERNGLVIETERLPGTMPMTVVDAFAEAMVRPGAQVTVGKALEGNRNGTIYQEVEVLTLGDLVGRYERAIGAIDLLQLATGRRDVVTKAKGGKFNSARHTVRLQRRLDAAHKATVDVTIGEMVEVTAVTDWTELNLTDAQAEINAIGRALRRAGSRLAKRITSPLLAEALRVVKDARAFDIKQHGWGKGGKAIPANGPVVPTLNAVDRKVISSIRKSQVNFVTNEFGRRQKAWSKVGREIVAHGHEQGLGTDAIAGDLSKWLKVRGGNPHYMRVVSQAYTVRAETYGHLSTFQRAGVEAARITSVLDEATTEICIHLDGKLIPVDKSLELMAKVNDLKDPQDVKTVQPWIRERLLDPETGRKELFYLDANGNDVRVAEVGGEAAAKDKIPDSKLIDHGIAGPPYHGLCRTTLTPVIV